MNPRVSRSSALASKATGFPIAKIAARLAIGYTLDEIRNDITGETPASFEPSLDYVVVKVPRFAFEKFPGADPVLTTHMKSVGEAMAIGGTFAEALQKAQRSLEQRSASFSWASPPATRLSCWPPARCRTTGGWRRCTRRCGPARRWPRCRPPARSTPGSSTRSPRSRSTRGRSRTTGSASAARPRRGRWRRRSRPGSPTPSSGS